MLDKQLTMVRANRITNVLAMRFERPDGSCEWKLYPNATPKSMQRVIRIGISRSVPCELQLPGRKPLRVNWPKGFRY